MQYLVSLGVDPSGVVIQRGAHNYAGPSCPGAGWNCTSSSRVLQIAAGRNAVNLVDLTARAAAGPPAGVPSIPCPTAGIVQTVQTGSGDNVAKVSITSASPQGCSITQSNTTGGANSVQIQETLTQSSGTSEEASQEVDITQSSTSGPNSVQVKQQVTQSISEPNATSVAETQTSNQYFSVHQSSSSGGTNSSQVDQSLSQAESAPKATSGSQSQNATLNGDVHQSSSGLSTSQGSQTENQSQTAKTSGVTQTQVGPMWFDPNQSGNPSDSFKFDQSATQTPGVGQTENMTGECDESDGGTCKFTQSITQGGNTTTNSCKTAGGSCFQQIACDAEGCTINPSCDLESCGPPPPPICPPSGCAVEKATPTMTTSADFTSPTTSNAIHDTATLSGGSSPGGTVTFEVFGPGDPTCSSSPAATLPNVPVNGDGVATSPDYTPTAAIGSYTYNWVAHYSGDANNNAVDGSCGDEGESLTVNNIG